MNIAQMLRNAPGFMKRSALVLAALALVQPAAQAATQYTSGTNMWDNGTTAAWNASTGGPYGSVWTNGNDAIFEGDVGTVSIAAAGATAHNLTFTTSGYLIQSNSLTLNGTAPTISLGTGISGTISSIIAGSAGLIKSGAGTLTLSGVNTYSGGTTVSAGTLSIGKASTRSGTTITGGATGTGNVTLADGVTENVNGDVTWYSPQVTLQGNITLAGNFRQTVGFATLDLNNGTRTIYVNPTGGNVKQTIPGNAALEGTGRSRWEMGSDVGVLTVQNGTLVLASNLTGNDYAGIMFRDASASFTGNLGVTVGPNVFLQTNHGNGLGSTTANTAKLTVNGIWGLLGSSGTATGGGAQTIYSLAGSGRVYASLTSANVNS
ncbi:MAG: autotransporter-associated beta strand repeat-containing protein, partial [bacterium]